MLISSLTDFTVVCDIVEVKEHLGGRERLSQVLLYSVYYTLRNHAQKYFSSDYWACTALEGDDLTVSLDA